MAARGGVVSVDEFAVISGAPLALKKQVSSSAVLETLISAGAVRRENFTNLGECVVSIQPEVALPDLKGARARLTAEGVILDGVREWARSLGLASYHFNCDPRRQSSPDGRTVQMDLSGPSYLLPLKGGVATPGFLAVHVFAEGVLQSQSIRYFVRKSQLFRATSNSGDVLPILVAEGFTGPALTAGHAAGVVLATPKKSFLGGKSEMLSTPSWKHSITQPPSRHQIHPSWSRLSNNLRRSKARRSTCAAFFSN